MKWVKQTFAERFNRRDGRTGHIWGDRYESRVLEGEPPEEGEDSANAAGAEGERGVNLAGAGLRGGRNSGVRPFGRKPAGKALFSHLSPHPPPPPPA
jgi:hypothetical protein